MKKITITEALSKLKITAKKIDKGSRTIRIAGIKNAKGVVNGNSQENEFLKKVRDDFQSMRDLEKNYQDLKSKIAQSNATTEVTVNGKKYTVVEAIERKNRIEQEKENLTSILRAYVKVENEVAMQNEQITRRIDNLLETKLGADSKNQKADDVVELKSKLFDADKVELVVPKEILEQVEKSIEDIENFSAEVDVALSIINAKTEIEVDL